MPIVKIHLAWKLLPISLVFVVLYILVYSNVPLITANSEAALSQASLLMIFSSSFASLAACWAGVQLSRTRTLHTLASRSRFQVLLPWFLPAFLGGVIAQTAGALGLLVIAGAFPSSTALLIFTAQITAIYFHTCIGFLIGLTVIRLAAYPLSLLVSYLWIAFAWTIEPVFIRYLAGAAMAMCCSVVEHIDPAAPLALILFSAVAGTGVLLLPPHKNRQGLRATSYVGLTLILAGALGGYLLAKNLGTVPTRYMADHELTCSQVEPEICTSPVSIAINDLRADFAKNFRKLHQLGLPEVSRALPYRGENLPALHEGTAYISYQPTMTAKDTSSASVSIYMAPLQQCLETYANANNLQSFKEFSDYATINGNWLVSYLNQENPQPPLLETQKGQDYYEKLLQEPYEQQKMMILNLYQELAQCSLPAS